MTLNQASANEVARDIATRLRDLAVERQPDRKGDWPGWRAANEYARLAAVVGTALLRDGLNSESRPLLAAILEATKAETTSLHTDADAEGIEAEIIRTAKRFADYSREVIETHNKSRRPK